MDVWFCLYSLKLSAAALPVVIAAVIAALIAADFLLFIVCLSVSLSLSASLVSVPRPHRKRFIIIRRKESSLMSSLD